MSRHLRNKVAIIIAIILSAIYAGFLITHMASYAGGADSSGYFNSAKLLAQLQTSTPIRTIPHFTPSDGDYYFQQPLGFSVVQGTSTLAPTYPAGLPLHLLIAAQIVGWDQAATLVNVLGALLCGWLTYLLARKYCHLPVFWAVSAVLLLWVCPLFVFFTLQPMSDMLSTLWCLLAFYSALNSRQRPLWGLLAGAAVGIAVLIRPTNLIIMLPVLFIVRENIRGWLFLILGGAPFAAIQILYNLKTYGIILTTGYGDVSTLLQSEFVGHNTLHFAQWVPQLLTPVVLLVLGLPWLSTYYPRLIPAMGAWIVGLIAFYAFYYHSGETWWYLRFILPTFPFLVLGALMVGQRLSESIRPVWVRTLISFVITSAALGYQYHQNRSLHVTEVQRSDRAYRETCEWLNENAPVNTITVAMQMSGSLRYYTEFPLVRYDLVTPEKFTRIRESARQHGQPIYAPLFPFEVDNGVTTQLGGTWEKVATLNHITIWKLQG